MEKKEFKFSQKKTAYIFDADFTELDNLTDRAKTILITDENVFRHHGQRFSGWATIVLPAGEQFKVQDTVNEVINKLIAMKADRKSVIIGIGGGVVTDLTGYVASVYMRGVRFGFIPVSILAMVDASIGGKNGIDVGDYKNLVGTINQPEFLLYDDSFLATLPENEWINGFAEVIKHACIKDAALFEDLAANGLATYRKSPSHLKDLIRRNVLIKTNVVMADEFETGERKLLNFGHTWGHAIETNYQLPHGHAVAIGMMMACRISEQLCGFNQTLRLEKLLSEYGLPTKLEVDKKKVFDILKMDKKRDAAAMNYVLLNNIGDAVVKSVPISELEQLVASIN